MEGAVALPADASSERSRQHPPPPQLRLAQDSVEVVIGSRKFLKLCEAAGAQRERGERRDRAVLCVHRVTDGHCASQTAKYSLQMVGTRNLNF